MLPSTQAPAEPKKRSRPKKLVEEPIPEPPKQQGPSKRLLFGQEIAVLTESEAVGLRAKLVESILDTSQEADRFISNTNRMGRQAVIWSTISRRDAEVLTDAILILGRRSAMVGLAVRGVVKTWTLYHAGIIVGPRLVETVGFYIAAGGPSLWPLILQFQNKMGTVESGSPGQ